MDASFSECWEWIFSYIKSGKRTRDGLFPAGDECGVSNVIREITKTLSGRIADTRYKHVALLLRFRSTSAKRIRPQVDTVGLPTPCPLLTREKQKIAAIAAALDMAATTGPNPPLGGPMWRRLLQIHRQAQTASRLYGMVINEADLRLIAGAANLHDAASAVRTGDYQSAVGLMTGAALFVSGADLPIKLAAAEDKVRKHQTQRVNATRARHAKNKNLKEKILEIVAAQNKKAPFTSHADAINWLIGDDRNTPKSPYFDTAKELGVSPTRSQASKTLRDWLKCSGIAKKSDHKATN
ncbi:hypothetical protein [Chitinibacter tainanensis]|uniref:hypothetical protein n=1 Tax=Chitinibacter tainanensis TaxID=230667 RepID=UPI002357F5FC|nr:hypothetical protein [Chitinibacter tainanensis]